MEQEQAVADKEQRLAELKEEVEAMEKELAESRQIADMEQQIADLEQKLAENGKQSPSPARSSGAVPPPPRRSSKEALSVRAPAPPPAPKVRSITLPEGTPLVVRTTTQISTKAAGTGDPFEASLEEPLMEGTTLIAAKGARVMGVIAHSDKGGRVKGRAQLEVRIRSFRGF